MPYILRDIIYTMIFIAASPIWICFIQKSVKKLAAYFERDIKYLWVWNIRTTYHGNAPNKGGFLK
jgi:hypothetical protein